VGYLAASAIDKMQDVCPEMHMKGMSMKMMDTKQDNLPGVDGSSATPLHIRSLNRISSKPIQIIDC
jgi:hypothetical protein